MTDQAVEIVVSQKQSMMKKGALCQQCPLAGQPCVPSEFNGSKYAIVGESPGWNEARAGKPFIEPGQSAKLLWGMLKPYNLTRLDGFVSNVVACWPGSGEEKEDVLALAARCCKPRLDYELAQLNIPYFLALGKVAREYFFGPEGPKESVTTLHGRWVKWHDSHAISAYHPAFVLRDPDSAMDLYNDLRKFATCVNRDDTPHFVDPPEIVVLGTLLKIDNWLRHYIANPPREFSFDLETDQVKWFYNRILLMTVSLEPNKSYIFPGPVLYQSTRDVPNDWAALFASRQTTFIGHNAKFDLRFIRHQLRVPTARVDFDTMLAHYAMDERKGTHDLKGLSARWLNTPDYETDIQQYLKTKNDRYGKIPFDRLCVYASQDSAYTLRLKHLFASMMDANEWRLFQEVLMPASELLLRAELRGFLIDQAYLEGQFDVFDKHVEDLKVQIRAASDGVIDNPNSPSQVAHFLFDILKLKLKSSRKVGPRSTNKDALIQLGDVHPVIPLMRVQRRVAKLKSAYIENILDIMDDAGVVHTDFQEHGTEVGRISARDPALQTIPRADDKEVGQYGKIIKDAFIARPGMGLFNCDFSQAELRVAAALSQEPFLLQVYRENRDLHTEVAVAMYGTGYTKTQRVLAKMFNFSYLYGGNEHSFAQDAGLPIAQARAFVHRYNEIMPRLAQWKEEQGRTMATMGEVVTPLGRKRRIPLIVSVNKDDARKASFHSPVAGTASDITLMTACKVQTMLDEEYGGRAHVLLLVHDSIIGEAPLEILHEVGERVRKLMEETAASIMPGVRWKADAEYGDRWGSVHALESK